MHFKEHSHDQAWSVSLIVWQRNQKFEETSIHSGMYYDNWDMADDTS